MFGSDGHNLKKRANRTGTDKVGLTDEQKFCKSIAAASHVCFVIIQDSWEHAPFLLCSGGKRRDKKLICTATLCLERFLFTGENRMSVLISIIAEE